MLIAKDVNGNHIRAYHDSKGFCPSCNSLCIAKCGDIKIWHWAHKSDVCSFKTEPETDWHLQWKEKALSYGCDIEVVIGNNRADATIHNDTVYEFQHSTMSLKEIINRTVSYSNLGYKVIWIFDYIDKYDKGDIIYYNKKKPYVRLVRPKYIHPTLFSYLNCVYLDVGDSILQIWNHFGYKYTYYNYNTLSTDHMFINSLYSYTYSYYYKSIKLSRHIKLKIVGNTIDINTSMLLFSIRDIFPNSNIRIYNNSLIDILFLEIPSKEEFTSFVNTIHQILGKYTWISLNSPS